MNIYEKLPLGIAHQLMAEDGGEGDAGAGTGGEGEGDGNSSDAGTGVTDDADASDSADAGDDEGSNSDADWRREMAGKDEKLYKKLQRYSTKEDVGKKITELEKLRSRIPMELSEKPTEEELKAYRKQAGIPNEAGEYEKTLQLDDGLVIGDDDREMLGKFFEDAHASNIPASHVNSMVNWYFKQEALKAGEFNELEKQQQQEAVKSLKEDMGVEYTKNMALTNAWLDRQDNDIGNILRNARGPDGVALFNNVDFAKWMVSHIRETEDIGTIMDDGDLAGSNVEAEIRKIQDVIRKDPDTYARDKDMQERMAKLSAAKRRMKK